MPHVITQSCCSDGSCVFACPVNCIHPSPDEPGFATSEMLYIDPVACVDCGACVSACPVGAIAPDTRLDRRAAAVRRDQRVVLPRAARRREAAADVEAGPGDPGRRGARRVTQPLTVAIVGSGPAAMYAADELLTQHGVRVNVFEKLPTPYGLVRAGVAPDHQNTKTGHPAIRPGCPPSRLPVLSQCRDRQAPEPCRPVGPPPRRAVRGRCAR